MSIPFNKAYSTPHEFDYLRESLASGQTAGDSKFTKRCHAWFREHFGIPGAFMTPSCTAALEMSALLLNIKPGDEVIVPSFTFVSTASAFALFGARLVFGDVREDTLSLDERLLPQLITPKTKAVVTVHYAGISHDPNNMLKVCEAHGLPLVEDNAHSLGGSFGGRPLGTFGKLATLSFHESKNFSCGEGGALLVNDESMVARAEILREKGTNRSSFLRREIAKYSWVDLGSSYLASDLCAAALMGQLDDFAVVQARRRQIWQRYADELAPWAAAQGVRLPHVPEGCDHANHLFYLLFPSNEKREAAIAWLKERGVEAYFHYLPLHSSVVGERVGTAPLGCPVTDRVSATLLRLPLYPALTDSQQNHVIQSLIDFI